MNQRRHRDFPRHPQPLRPALFPGALPVRSRTPCKKNRPPYEKRVLATGSEVCLPPIQGVDKKGVFTLRKSMSWMAALKASVHRGPKAFTEAGD